MNQGIITNPMQEIEPYKFVYLYSKNEETKLTYSSLYLVYKYNKVKKRRNQKFTKDSVNFSHLSFQVDSVKCCDSYNKDQGNIVRIAIEDLKSLNIYGEWGLWDLVFRKDTKILKPKEKITTWENAFTVNASV